MSGWQGRCGRPHGLLIPGSGLIGQSFSHSPVGLFRPSVNLGAYVLSQTSFQIFGTVGMAFLAVMVHLDLLYDDGRLIAAVSTFFAEEFTVLSYKQYVTLICVVSFLLANLGLNQIIQSPCRCCCSSIPLPSSSSC